MKDNVDFYEKQHLLANNYSPLTRDAYLAAIREFLRFTGKRTITREILLKYREHLNSKKLQASSKNTRISAIRSFLQFLSMHDKNFTTDYRYVFTLFKDRNGTKNHINIPKDIDIEKFVDSLTPSHYSLFAKIILATGLRLSEVLSLKPGQLDTKFVIVGKGSKQRVVFCNDVNLVKSVRDYEKTLKKGSRLFPFTKRAVQAKFSALGMHVHLLRHVYATRRIEAGMPISVAQRVLGHSSVTTTQRYLHIADEFLEESTRATDAKIRKV